MWSACASQWLIPGLRARFFFLSTKMDGRRISLISKEAGLRCGNRVAEFLRNEVDVYVRYVFANDREPHVIGVIFFFQFFG